MAENPPLDARTPEWKETAGNLPTKRQDAIGPDTRWNPRDFFPDGEFTRDPAEEACYDIQMACWQFQTAIEQAESPERIARLDNFLIESRRRLELVVIALGARTAQIDEAKR